MCFWNTWNTKFFIQKRALSEISAFFFYIFVSDLCFQELFSAFTIQYIHVIRMFMHHICHKHQKHKYIFVSSISVWQARGPPAVGGSADYSWQPMWLALILISFWGFALSRIFHPNSSLSKRQVQKHSRAIGWKMTFLVNSRDICRHSLQLFIMNTSMYWQNNLWFTRSLLVFLIAETSR